MLKNEKILIVFGAAEWSHQAGLSFCSSISSSQQFYDRLQLEIYQFNRLLAKMQAKGERVDGCVDLVRVYEGFTSKVCHGCKTKSLISIYKRVERQNQDGNVVTQWIRTRWFECTHRGHQGKKKMNRDVNASRNMAQNLIYAAFNRVHETTWMIGKQSE